MKQTPYQYNLSLDTLRFIRYKELVHSVEPSGVHLDNENDHLQSHYHAFVDLHADTLLVRPLEIGLKVSAMQKWNGKLVYLYKSDI